MLEIIERLDELYKGTGPKGFAAVYKPHYEALRRIVLAAEAYLGCDDEDEQIDAYEAMRLAVRGDDE